jgi:hypothetical protein
MEACSNCDFCELLNMRKWYCDLYEEEVGENDWCPEHQNEGRFLDGDDDDLEDDPYGETEG